MKTYRRPLLAGLAVMAALLAVSASASAAVWKDHTTNVSKAIEIGLTGGTDSIRPAYRPLPPPFS